MKKINESFICVECGQQVSQAFKTCRNHCPYCFVSLHLDEEIPGDRNAHCGGVMYPVSYELKHSDYKILFQCVRCGKQHWNKRASDDEVSILPVLIQKYRDRFERKI